MSEVLPGSPLPGGRGTYSRKPTRSAQNTSAVGAKVVLPPSRGRDLTQSSMKGTGGNAHEKRRTSGSNLENETLVDKQGIFTRKGIVEEKKLWRRHANLKRQVDATRIPGITEH